eukprot:TRINITY_DN8844_c0_g1_i4.p1 TRINITY_DN8844_c0_g1~~TRINITY_DN8844_c0_g1_i4.p1  ORF type:complete len:413 (+),score=38.14 TRINITY_DN8844_c0_g1_i4:207-1445(+)
MSSTIPFGYLLLQHFPLRGVAISLVLANTFFLIVSAYCKSFWPFVICFIFIPNFINGAISYIPIYCNWKYFPNKKGLLSGISFGAMNLSTLMFKLVSFYTVNPNDNLPTIEVRNGNSIHYYFEKNIYENVPYMLRVFAAIYFVLAFFGCLLIKVPKEYEYRPVETSSIRSAEEEQAFNGQPQVHRQTVGEWLEEAYDILKEVVKKKDFILLFVCGLFSTQIGFFMRICYKSYGFLYYRDDQYLTLVGTMMTVTGTIARLLWGGLLDFWTFKRIYWTMIISLLLFTITTHPITELGKASLYTLWVFGINLFEGGHFSTFPVVAMHTYGEKKFHIVYCILLYSFGFSGLLVYLTILTCLPILGYGYLFVVFSVIQTVPMFILPFYTEKFKYRNPPLEAPRSTSNDSSNKQEALD